MGFDRGWLVSPGVLVALAASLLSGPVLAQEPPPWRLPLTYPSAEAPTVPRNAQFFAIVGHRERLPGMMLDDDYSGLENVGETGVHRLRFTPGELLSPGPHRLYIDAGSSGAKQLAIEVQDALGPESDEVASVRVTRAVRFVTGPSFAEIDAAWLEMRALAADPADCSTIVVEQLYPIDDLTPWFAGEYRLELEAEGPVLGFIVDGAIFLPGDCRGAFLPSLGKRSQGGFETGPLLVQVITATGVGTTEEYAGAVDEYTPSAADLVAPVDPSDAKVSAWCSVDAPGSQRSRGIGVPLALLSCVGLARRRGRWLRAARP